MDAAALDAGAFERLFRELHAPLCEVVDSYVRSQAIAEEIVQDLFFVLWMKRESLPVRDSLRGYLFTAARNRALHHLRHQTVVRRLALLIRSPDANAMGLVRSPSTPVETLEADESERALRMAIDAIPPRSRLALVLRADHGMTNSEIAMAMGISVKGVEKLMATALRHLRAQIGRDDVAATEPVKDRGTLR